MKPLSRKTLSFISGVTLSSVSLLILLFLIPIVSVSSTIQDIPASINGWVQTTPLPVSLANHISILVNNQIYVVGGSDGYDNYRKNVYYTSILPDGSLGDWTTTTPLPGIWGANRTLNGSLVFSRNNKVYVWGVGKDGYENPNKLLMADITADGRLRSWSQISAPPAWCNNADGVMYNDRIYLVLGTNSTTSLSTCCVYYAEFNPDGSITSWNQTLGIPQDLSGLRTLSMNGYLYVMGQYPGNVYSCIPLSNGQVTTWTGYPAILTKGALFVGNTTLYYTDQRNIYSRGFNSDGSFSGGWIPNNPALPIQIAKGSFVFTDKLYALGGNWGLYTNSYYSTVWYYTGPTSPGLTVGGGFGPVPQETKYNSYVTCVADIYDNWSGNVISQWSCNSGKLSYGSITGSQITNLWIPPHNSAQTTQFYWIGIQVQGSSVYSLQTGYYVKVLPDINIPEVINLAAVPEYQSVTLTWQNPTTTISGYTWQCTHLFRLTNNQNPDSEIYVGIGTTFTDTGLADGTTFYYRAVTYTTDSLHSLGTMISGTPYHQEDISNFNSLTKYPQLYLSWKNPTTSQYQNTVILRKSGSYPQFPGDGTLIYSGTDTSSWESSLTLNSTYYYRAYAQMTDGEYSLGTTMVALTIYNTIPNVTQFNAESGFRYIKLTWQNPTSLGGYSWGGVVIIRTLNSMDDPFSQGIVVFMGEGTTYTDSSVLVNRTYYYTIYTYTTDTIYSSGVMVSGVSSYTGDIANFNYRLDYPYVTLTWNNPTDRYFRDVIILRKIDSKPNTLTDGEVIYIGNSTSFQDTTLTMVSTYYYRVWAQLDSGSEYSLGTSIISLCLNGNLHYLQSIRGSFSNEYRVKNNFLYIADSTRGFYIYDVSDSSYPRYLVYCTTTCIVNQINIQGKYAYLVEGIKGLEIADISNPTMVHLVSHYYSGYTIYNVELHGDYAYLAEGDHGLEILNIMNPSNPILISTLSVNSSLSNLHYYRGYLYTNGIIDVTDPYAPCLISSDNYENETFYKDTPDFVDGNLSITYVTVGWPGYLHFPYWYIVFDYNLYRNILSDFTTKMILNHYETYDEGIDSIFSLTHLLGLNSKYIFNVYNGNLRTLDCSNSYQILDSRIPIGNNINKMQVQGYLFITNTINGQIDLYRYSRFTDANYIEIADEPEGDVNPAYSGDVVLCTVYPSDNWASDSYCYQWSAETGILSDPTIFNPLWIAPANSTETTQYYRIQVTVSNRFGTVTTASYLQGVRPGSVNGTLSNVCGLVAAPSYGGVILSWENPNESDYAATRIVYRTDRYPTGPNDGTCIYWYNGTQCNVAGINGQKYYFGVYAHDTGMNFAPGAFVAAIPNSYSNVSNFNAYTSTPLSGAVLLQWSNPSVTQSYNATLVIRRKDRYPLDPADGYDTGDGTWFKYWYNGNQYGESNLANGSTYYYGIYSNDTIMNFSGGMVVKYISGLKGIGNVRNLSSFPGTNSIILQWSSPTESNYVGTLVVRRPDRYPENPTDGIIASWTGSTQAVCTRLDLGRKYYFTLFSQDTGMNFSPGIGVADYSSNYSNVQNVMDIPGSKSAFISWKNPTRAYYQATRVVRRTDRMPLSPFDGNARYWFNGNILIDGGLENGTTYYYAIYAHDSNYNFSQGIGICTKPVATGIDFSHLSQSVNNVSLCNSNSRGTTDSASGWYNLMGDFTYDNATIFWGGDKEITWKDNQLILMGENMKLTLKNQIMGKTYKVKINYQGKDDIVLTPVLLGYPDEVNETVTHVITPVNMKTTQDKENRIVAAALYGTGELSRLQILVKNPSKTDIRIQSIQLEEQSDVRIVQTLIPEYAELLN